MNTSFKRYSIAAELLTCVVYQRYMQTEIQPRYKTPIFDPNLCLQSASLTPLFSFSTVNLSTVVASAIFYSNALFG